jgi:hypothetical protein
MEPDREKQADYNLEGCADLLRCIRKPWFLDETDRSVIQKLEMARGPLSGANIRHFRDCPPAQMRLCEFYELRRESEILISLALAYHAGQLLDTSSPDYWLDKAMVTSQLWIIVEIPEFPGASWLDLPDVRRKALEGRKRPTIGAARGEPAFRVLPHEHIARLDAQWRAAELLAGDLPSFHRLYLAEIDVRRSKQDLQRDFTEWVDQERKRLKQQFPDRKNPFENRGDAKDSLRKLSAWRIHRALPGWDYPRLALHFGDVYQNPADWSRGVRECELMISED